MIGKGLALPSQHRTRWKWIVAKSSVVLQPGKKLLPQRGHIISSRSAIPNSETNWIRLSLSAPVCSIIFFMPKNTYLSQDEWQL